MENELNKNSCNSSVPEGPTPWLLHNQVRHLEIVSAIERYVQAKKDVPGEWVLELIELENYFKKYERRKNNERARIIFAAARKEGHAFSPCGSTMFYKDYDEFVDAQGCCLNLNL